MPSCRALAALGACMLMLAGCRGEPLPCSVAGTVRGEYEDSNLGRVDPRHGIGWQRADGSWRVVLTDRAEFVMALRGSPDPEREFDGVRVMLGAPVFGFSVDPDGDLVDYFARIGMPSKEGRGGDARGHAALDDAGCLRGDYWEWKTRRAQFSVPVAGAAAAAMASMAVEAGADVMVEVEPPSDPQASADLMQHWRLAHAALSDPSRVRAFESLGFSEPVALELAQMPSALDMLERLQRQCPLPERSAPDEYGDIQGIAEAAPGVELESTLRISHFPDIPPAFDCYTMSRNGQPTEQCWVSFEDCAR